MMNNTILYQLINDSTLFDGNTLADLDKLVDEYPCFSLARILYIKNLEKVKDLRLGSKLQHAAIYLPDRKKLFAYIEGPKYHLSAEEDEKQISNDNSFSLINNYLSDKSDSSVADSNLLVSSPVSTDYMSWSLSNDSKRKRNSQTSDNENTNLQHQELIDSFIENGPKKKNVDNASSNQISVPVIPKSLDDSFFTETLAHIYIKQHRYEKALQIIQNLSLKYPEKNIYFADQIRFLKKLIINTKKIR